MRPVVAPPADARLPPDLAQWQAEFGPSLLSYARRRVEAELAEEAVQELMLSAAAKLAEGFSPDEPKAWLFSILRRRIVDAIRKTARDRKLAAEVAELIDRSDPAFQEGSFAITPMKWGGDPQQELRRKEFWAAFDHAVDNLPLRMRQAFLLREIDGEPTTAVCEALEITPGNLWVLIHRARLRLREALAPLMED